MIVSQILEPANSPGIDFSAQNRANLLEAILAPATLEPTRPLCLRHNAVTATRNPALNRLQHVSSVAGCLPRGHLPGRPFHPTHCLSKSLSTCPGNEYRFQHWADPCSPGRRASGRRASHLDPPQRRSTTASARDPTGVRRRPAIPRQLTHARTPPCTKQNKCQTPIIGLFAFRKTAGNLSLGNFIVATRRRAKVPHLQATPRDRAQTPSISLANPLEYFLPDTSGNLSFSFSQLRKLQKRLKLGGAILLVGIEEW